ncbi:MAG: Gfo/Idh/MocA family oxidoreductase [candidate division WOR-3 bacterium]
MTRVSLIGLGNWGKNILRTLINLHRARISLVCDVREEVLQEIIGLYPELVGTRDPDRATEGVDAAIIATPSPTHHRIAKAALEKGVHVFVEKPMAMSVSEAEELVDLAEKKGLLLFPGHILLFHPGIQRLKNLLEGGELGRLFYIYSQRTNLGVIRKDENVVWSLAPHDIYISNYLMGTEPVSAAGFGKDFLQDGVEDVAFITLEYPGDRFSHIHVSWLDPKKTRRLTVVCSERMAVLDDMEEEEKLKIYDKGVVARLSPDEIPPGTFHIRYGDIWSPKLDKAEPLHAELSHFLDCIEGRAKPITDGRDGLAVARVLEQISRP